MSEAGTVRAAGILGRDSLGEELCYSPFVAAGPAQDSHPGQTEQLFKVPPGIQLKKGVQTQYEKKVDLLAVEFGQLAERDHCVRLARYLYLHIRHLKPRMVPRCYFQHPPAMPVAENAPCQLMGRNRRRYKKQGVKPQGLDRLFGQPQMSQMDGIKSPPHHSHPSRPHLPHSINPLSLPLLTIHSSTIPIPAVGRLPWQ